MSFTRNVPKKDLMTSLRYKAWALVIACVVVLTSVAVWFSSRSISTSFSAMELARAEQTGERARRLLRQQLDNLSASSRDYAYWHDTVQFVEGENPSFMGDNFTTDSLRSLKVSGVLLFGADGQLRGATALSEQAELVAPDAGVRRAAEALVPAVLADARSETVVDTYREVDGTLYLMTAAPVRNQPAVGTVPRGAQVMYSRLDPVQRERFGEVLMNPVTLSFGPNAAGDADFELRILGEGSAEARALVRDHQGRPVARLVVGLDRLLHQQGKALVWAAASQVALAGLILGALLVLLLDRLMLRRLKHMQRQLTEIGERGARADFPIDEAGDDELSDVAKGLNRVLELTRQMAEQRDRLSELASQLIASQENERRVVARELHDQIGQILTALHMQLAAHRARTADTALDGPIELADEALMHARDLTAALHPHILDDLGLNAALNWQINRYVLPSLGEVRLKCDLSPERADPAIELVVFRVVQEALTNVVRHAKASSAEVELNTRDGWLQLDVADDGEGFRAGDTWFDRHRQTSIGVASMRERVEERGGHFDIDSAPGMGTRLRVLLPWPSLAVELGGTHAGSAG